MLAECGVGYTVDYQACKLVGSRNLTYETCNVTFTLDQDMDAQGPCFDHDLEYQVKGAFRVIELPWKSCPEPHLVEELP